MSLRNVALTGFMCTLLAVLAVLVVPGSTVAEDKPELLPQDPRNTYGKLDNGFRYIVRRHANPPGKFAMYLHVETGALNETASQNGIAHFLEHMAFNGSKNFPAGTLIPKLNDLGMTFGAHTNAHTNHHETVYKLIMPNNAQETVELALTILADDANGLLLEEEEIEKERQIILEEYRRLKGARQRLREEMMRKTFAGTRFAEHTVIGIEEQILSFPRSEFVDYYNTWYRPERMILIAVGDIDEKQVIERVKHHFGEFQPRGPAREYEGTGVRPVLEPRAFLLTDPELRSCSMTIGALMPGRRPMRTFADFRLSEIENMSNWIVNRRLQNLVQAGEASFLGAGTSVTGIYSDVIAPGASFSGQPEKWQAMLQQVIMEVNRAIQHGFTEHELELARKEWLATAEYAAEVDATRESREIVPAISRNIGAQHPLMSPDQHLALVQRIVKDATVAELHRVFRQNYKTRNYTYALEFPDKAGLTRPTPVDILTAAAEAWDKKVEKREVEAVDLTVLEKLPEGGKIAEQSTDAATGVTTAVFENGVIVHHRAMDTREGQVMVQITTVGGSLEESAENRGVSGGVGLANATSRMTASDIRDAMTGVNVQVMGGAGSDAASLFVAGSTDDLEPGLQLAHAMLTDGRIEETAFANWKQLALRRLEQQQSQPQWHLDRTVIELIYGGDVRFMPLGAEQIQKLDRAAAEKWMHRIAGGPKEIAIVGDLPREQALKLATRYFGSLPKATRDFQALDALRKIERPEGPYSATVKVKTITPQAMVLSGFLGCNERDVRDRRVLTLASRILSDRMRKVLREEKQLVYSVGCTNQAASDIPGSGLFFARAATDPGRADELADGIQQLMKEFAKDGPTAEELSVVQKQVATQIEQQQRDPRTWLAQLSDLRYRGRTLGELANIAEEYATITAEELQKVTQRYITDERAVRVVVVPTAPDPQ